MKKGLKWRRLTLQDRMAENETTGLWIWTTDPGNDSNMDRINVSNGPNSMFTRLIRVAEDSSGDPQSVEGIKCSFETAVNRSFRGFLSFFLFMLFQWPETYDSNY